MFRNEGDISFDATVNNFSIGQGSIFENRELGVITVVDGASITGGPFINTGLIRKTTGTGTATIRTLTNNSPGILSIETGNMDFNDNFEGDGIITGAGSIGTNYNTEIGQTIAPGNNGVGTLTYNNTLDFEATPDCIYQLEINGTAAGTEHDVFAITNKARLFGTLDIILGYNAQLNDEFVIITFPNRNECELPAQVTATFGNGTYTYDVVCNSDNVTLKVIDIVLGVEDNQLSNAVLYPNPTSGNFNIDLGKSYSETNTTITNILGQVVAFERFANTNTLEINLQGSPGIYFVNLKTAEGVSETLKIIKN
ncbi:T9SS type A sorting domain-containing protein [Aequorivita capsosiphonis]|uniref:T9SS type A sorting domain-containing protein n=1 Tax=Aequorivita capsosiphonis TaxID=487317 RepID=UPI0003F59E07|nr:T9SS type A sorting domain-containing protein [Aequorivita capsosiphonis]